MKRFAPILLAFLCLTACPQVGTSLVPGVVAAGGPAPEEDAQNSAWEDLSPEDSGSEDLPSDAAPSAPEDVPPPSDPSVSSAPPAPASPEDVTGGGATGGYERKTDVSSGSGFVAIGDPVDPKSDQRVIDHPKYLYADVRLQYGADFENTLDPDDEELPDIPRDADGKIHLSAEAQTKWHKHSDWKDSPKGDVVRMIYRPEDKSSETKYCDVRVSIDYSEEEGGNVLFSGRSAGPGRLDFYQLTPVWRKSVKESVNDTSDPIALCESGWQKLDKWRQSKVFWDFLGSFNSAPQSETP